MILLGTGWGEGLAAFEQVMQLVDLVWFPCAMVLAFLSGYICGGIVQRG